MVGRIRGLGRGIMESGQVRAKSRGLGLDKESLWAWAWARCTRPFVFGSMVV